MSQRALFVGAAKQRRATFRSLCRAFGIAPKTGYKWLELFDRDGVDGLRDRSRRPRSNSRALAGDIQDRLLALRSEYPTWGPRKLLGWLELNEPQWVLPAASTVGLLLKRHGLVRRPREEGRIREPRMTAPLAHATSPNALWSMDFKGSFLVGDGSRCYPLTITDNFSRFLLRCSGLPGEFSNLVWRELLGTFRAYGLPERIRVDNQQPWIAPKGDLGLTDLSVKLLRLGIGIERIAPGRPQDNGRHERFHLTLKQDTALPPGPTLRTQQARFVRFRPMYNNERPHEALGQRPPATLYQPSWRLLPLRLPQPTYPSWFEVETLNSAGRLRWKGTDYFISSALRYERVGLAEVDEGCFQLWFCHQPLGHIHTAHASIGLLPI